MLSIIRRLPKISVGSCFAAKLSSHGDSVSVSAGQVIKAVTYGITENNTNSALTIMEVASPNSELLLQEKSASNNGVIGSVLGDKSDADTQTSAMIPLYITDEYSIRLNGALGSAGDLCYVAYIRVE